MEPLRILIADDNVDSQRAAARILEDEGARVDVAAHGDMAVSMAAQTRYDIILMDVQMPERDGVAAAEAIRAAEKGAGEEPVPIVAFTAHGVTGLRERCLAAGMNDYVAKPIATRDLIEAVRRWADRRPAVLVADDSPQVRQLVAHQLRDSFRIVTAADGREALAQFARQRIAVVLLDMNMPILDGYATAAEIRRRDDGRNVPIIALTASDDEQAKQRAIAAGCTSHLAKPMRLPMVRAVVHAAAGVPQAGQELQGEPSGAADAAVELAIDPLMEDLIPDYVREKRRQIGDLRRLTAAGDFEQVQRIAHDLKGTGSAYGIPDVTRLGRALEEAGRSGDPTRATALVDELDALLTRVQERLDA